MLDRGLSGGEIEDAGDGHTLVEATIPVTKLVIVGAAALADDLLTLASWLGWEGVGLSAEDARAELAVLAEIAAVRSGRDGRPLKDGTLPIMR